MSDADVALLEARRSAILVKLSDPDLDRPNASGSGHTIDRQGYRQSLLNELERINTLIAKMAGPFEVI